MTWTDWKYPASAGNVSEGTISWSNVANAKTDDGNSATVSFPAGADTYYSDLLRVVDFDFSDISTRATIVSVEVRVERKASGTFYPVKDYHLYLVNSGARIAGNKASSDNWPSIAFAIKTYSWTGSDVSSLTRSIVNGDNFGIEISAQNTNLSSATTGYIDYISMRIEYSMPPPVTYDVSGNIVCSSVISGFVEHSGDIINDVSGNVAVDALLSGYIRYPGEKLELPCLLSGTDTLSDCIISLDLDDTFAYGQMSIGTFYNIIDVVTDSEPIVVETGIDGDVDGEFFTFFPASVTIEFILMTTNLLLLSDAYRYFRDAVKSVVILREDITIFKGTLDRPSVESDCDNKIISATFLPFTGIDMDIKSGDSEVDYDLIGEIFGDQTAWKASPDTIINVDSWFRIKYVINSLLTYFGADTVEWGNFNSFFSSFIICPPATSIISDPTPISVGYGGPESFASWLLSASPNILFDQLLIFKNSLFGRGDYQSAQSQTLKDLFFNVTTWIGAIAGVDRTGKGWVIPVGEFGSVVSLADSDIITCRKRHYLTKKNGVAGIGWVHNNTTAFNIESTDILGSCFYNGNENNSTLRGTVSFNTAGIHYEEFWQEATIYNRDDVLKVNFPISPSYYYSSTVPVIGIHYNFYPVDDKSPGNTVNGFGYAHNSDDNEVSLNSTANLYGVMYTGAGIPSTEVTGTHVCEMAKVYYEFRKVDREIFELQLKTVDHDMVNLYQLAEDSVYGAGVYLRPINIKINLSEGLTTMECINVTRY